MCVGRFAENDFGVGTLLAQHAPDAGHGPAGAVSGDPVVEPVAVEIGHDFRRRGLLVDVGVGFGFELPGQEPAILLGQLDGLWYIPNPFRARGVSTTLAPRKRIIRAARREAVGHRDDQRIALGRADHGQPNAGVAAGGFNDRLAWLQRAAALGGLDDVEREPILDRAAGLKNSDLT